MYVDGLMPRQRSSSLDLACPLPLEEVQVPRAACYRQYSHYAVVSVVLLKLLLAKVVLIASLPLSPALEKTPSRDFFVKT